MSLKQRVLKGDAIEIPSGPSLLESLWNELLREWADPDDESVSDYDAGYCVGLAYAIGKIKVPYSNASNRIEQVLQEARFIKRGTDGLSESV